MTPIVTNGLLGPDLVTGGFKPGAPPPFISYVDPTAFTVIE